MAEMEMEETFETEVRRKVVRTSYKIQEVSIKKHFFSIRSAENFPPPSRKLCQILQYH